MSYIYVYRLCTNKVFLTILECSHLRVMDYIKEFIKKKNCYDAYHCASIYDLYYNHECQIIPRKRLVYDIFEVAKDVK